MSEKLQQSPRLHRELKTVSAMIKLYCHHHHKTDTLCQECQQLISFCARRLERCIYGANKPTCAKCPVHCYKPAQQEQIKKVMSWAGPRLLIKHPILTIRHLLDDRKPLPDYPINKPR